MYMMLQIKSSKSIILNVATHSVNRIEARQSINSFSPPFNEIVLFHLTFKWSIRLENNSHHRHFDVLCDCVEPCDINYISTASISELNLIRLISYTVNSTYSDVITVKMRTKSLKQFDSDLENDCNFASIKIQNESN